MQTYFCQLWLKLKDPTRIRVNLFLNIVHSEFKFLRIHPDNLMQCRQVKQTGHLFSRCSSDVAGYYLVLVSNKSLGNLTNTLPNIQK